LATLLLVWSFGPMAIARESEFGLQVFIGSKLGKGKKAVTIPPGRYTIAPQKGGHLLRTTPQCRRRGNGLYRNGARHLD
jgi:hypothetical protein